MPPFELGGQLRTMLGWILLGLFLLIATPLIYLLFAPIRIVIHTAQNEYAVQVVPLAKAQFLLEEAVPWIIIRVPFKTFRINLFDPPRGKKKKPKKKKPRAKRSKKRKVPVWDLLRSIRVKELRIDIDTGSPIANELLITLAIIFSRNEGHYLDINFYGYKRLDLVVEVRAYRIGWLLIRANTKTFFSHHKTKMYGPELRRTAG